MVEQLFQGSLAQGEHPQVFHVESQAAVALRPVAESLRGEPMVFDGQPQPRFQPEQRFAEAVVHRLVNDKTATSQAAIEGGRVFEGLGNQVEPVGKVQGVAVRIVAVRRATLCQSASTAASSHSSA